MSPEPLVEGVVCARCGKAVPVGGAICDDCPGVVIPLGTADHPLLMERTAKRIKIHLLVGLLMMLLGVLIVGWDVGTHLARFDFSYVTLSIGAAMLVFGAVYFLMARVAAWWNHG